jgi:hypothetical protein
VAIGKTAAMAKNIRIGPYSFSTVLLPALSSPES